MSEKSESYIVTTNIRSSDNINDVIDNNLIILGIYSSLEESKNSIENHVRLLMTDDKRTLTIYKVPLEDFKLYTFTKSDLKSVIDKAKLTDINLEKLDAKDAQDTETRLQNEFQTLVDNGVKPINVTTT